MKTTRIFCALLSAIMVVMFASCSEEDYGAEVAYTPADTTATTDTTTHTTPADPVYNGVQGTYIIVNGDTIEVSRLMIGLGDSLITREIRFKINMFLEGPDSLVVMDPAATVYTGTTGRPQTTEGDFTLEGVDSLRTETTTSGFKFSYYQMSVTTTNKVGYTLICGRREAYEQAYLTTTFHRFNSVWEEENVVRNDSIFHRERTTNEFNVTARWKDGERSFVLSKVVIIDHFVGLVEPEVTPTPTTVNADFWATGLKTFVSGSRVYREDLKTWSDAYLFECEDSYFIVLANYRVNDKEEEFISFEEKVVSKSTSPYSSKYNGVTYYNGGFYPAVITAVNGNYKNGWTLIAVVNGAAVSKNHDAQTTGVAAGIKNFQGDNTAYPTPIIPTTPSVKEVNGKKVIGFTGKTSVHTVTKTVADASLKN